MELQRRVILLELALKEKDRQIERFLRDRDQEILIATKMHPPCQNCENLKQRWRKIHAHFQEVPRLLDQMIDRTDRLFEEI